jgi:predicted HicB family RNase H-like nuclease
MTEASEIAITELHRAKVPLKAIGHRFGIPEWKVSMIALRRGAEPRHVHSSRDITVKLRGAVYEDLVQMARQQRTSPEVLIREAIAAYLGHDL